MPKSVPARIADGETSLDELTIETAQKVWDYMLMGHKMKKCDLIFVLGNPDLRTARHASRLFLQGHAPLMLISGKDGSLTKGKWSRPEADVFRDIAVAEGVPPDRILLEREATNTGENVLFSSRLLQSHGISPKSIILVQTPYMERRTYATFMRQWPGAEKIDVIVTSPDIAMRDYPCDDVGSLRYVISVMIGCLQRIKTYPEKGFQIPQHIPDDVWSAKESLLATGFFEEFSV